MEHQSGTHKIKINSLEAQPINGTDIYFIITKHKTELEDHMFNPEDVIDIDFDGCVADGGFMGNATGITARRFKGVSMEELEQLESMSKNEIDKILSSQSFDDTGGVYLGGFTM